MHITNKIDNILNISLVMSYVTEIIAFTIKNMHEFLL